VSTDERPHANATCGTERHRAAIRAGIQILRLRAQVG
jgi:hypothetical protein